MIISESDKIQASRIGAPRRYHTVPGQPDSGADSWGCLSLSLSTASPERASPIPGLLLFTRKLKSHPGLFLHRVGLELTSLNALSPRRVTNVILSPPPQFQAVKN